MKDIDNIINEMADRMARSIDEELLADMKIALLVDQGWTQTNVNPAFTDMGMLSGRFEEWYSQTAEWIHLNTRGDYRLIKGQWLFQNPRDATLFILRWS
jgi:hypothetical protein